MSRVLTNASASDRSPVDFYATPWDVTAALMSFVDLPNDTTVWECASGTGAMSTIIARYVKSVIGTDVSNGRDFLTEERLIGDWIITNPPFSLAHEFIDKAHELRPKGFALLLKSQFWHARKRLDLFQRTRPSFILPLTWRPDFLFGEKSGSPTMDCLWTVWLRDNQDQCRFVPLQRPRIASNLAGRVEDSASQARNFEK